MKTLLLPIVLEWLALNGGPAVDVEATLGAPRFRVRQQAAHQLEAAWPMSEATLRHAERSADHEVAETARAIRKRCRDRVVAEAPWADWPLWSVETHGWTAERCPPLDRAVKRELPCACAYPWENYRDVSRRWALQGLHDGWATPAIINIWFTIGRAVDADYHPR